MSATNEDTRTKVSTDAATEFVESFYSALESSRSSISTFYAPTLSTILFNGNAVPDGSSVQDIFVNQMPPTHYEVQSFDCQIINPSYPAATGIPAGSVAAVSNMSLLVTVSGYVKFGDHREMRDSPNRGFSETFVLVPDPVEPRPGVKGKGKKHWLIQSQNFRLVV